jgi:hypothetical protein
MPKKCKKNKKERNKENLPPQIRDATENNRSGLNSGRMWEAVPTLNTGGCEYIYPKNPSPTNAQIVIGRDRPGALPTGHGGRGHTQCGMIDLVAGRMSSVEGGPQSNIFVDPNFSTDAARIYISQKTSIDKHLDLCEGYVGLSKNKSAIGLKADSLRFVARQGIKLVTLPPNSEETSTGCKTKTIYGIELNAGNMDGSRGVKGNPFKRIKNLQPIPLGDNLVDALVSITREIEDLSTRFDSFVTAQMGYNRTISTHSHIGNLGAPVMPDPILIGDNVVKSIKMFIESKATDWTQRLNLSIFRQTFLKETGEYWICSRMNRTT